MSRSGTGSGMGMTQRKLDEEAKEATKTAKDEVAARLALLASAPLATTSSDADVVKEGTPKTGPNQMGYCYSFTH